MDDSCDALRYDPRSDDQPILEHRAAAFVGFRVERAAHRTRSQSGLFG